MILAGLRNLDSVSGTRCYTQLMEKLSAETGALVPGIVHMSIHLPSWYKTHLPLAAGGGNTVWTASLWSQTAGCALPEDFPTQPACAVGF